ncbi:MAG: serine hydrolase [Parachlamydiales bacterium]|nr:serine hydrolase [Parachlamydiales bacterium]
MLKRCALFLYLIPIFLNGGIFDWFETLSPKAERAKMLLEDFDLLIEKALIDFQVPGIAVGVVVDGHVVYAKGFGYRDIENKLPVTSDTLFAIGSCTKAFTTFVVGNLVDEGRIGWDDPVIDVLPEFRLWDQYATTNVTLRDLLTHRTGMPRHEFVWYNSKMSKEEMLRRIRFLQPSFDIRQRYQYGNLMYFIAGLAMERASGKPWEQLVKDRILSPLEMDATNFSVIETQMTRNFAYPYIEKKEVLKKMPFRNLSLISAAGAMNSNVEDMTHWLKMLLAGGVYKSQALISPATLQELHAPQVIVPGVPESKESLLYAYGIGWGVISYLGHYYVSHDGVSDGFTSVTGLLPGENIGIVVLSNKNMTPLPRYVSFQIMDRLLGLPYHDWFQEGVDSIRRNRQTLKEKVIEDDLSRKKGTTPSHPLQEFVGTYEHPGYGKVEISLEDGKLQAIYNDLRFVLDHWHYDVFRVSEEKQDMIISVEGTKFTFCNNADGEIGELIVPFEPLADDIVFKRKSEERLSALSYLRQFTGIYEIYGYTVEIVIRNHALVAIVPGQPNQELLPTRENEFTVKGLTGSTVRFVMDEMNAVEEVLLIQPYGAFSAKPRK